MDPHGLSSTSPLATDLYQLSLPSFTEYRERYRACFELAEGCRKIQAGKGRPFPNVGVVIKACELVQEFPTIKVNGEILARREKGAVAAFQRFSLPGGFGGFEPEFPGAPRAVVRKWQVDYPAVLRALSANAPDLASGAFGAKAADSSRNALVRQIEITMRELWLHGEPILSRSHSRRVEFSISDIVKEPSLNQVRGGSCSGPLETAYERSAVSLRDAMRSFRNDFTRLTRLDSEFLFDPRRFFDQEGYRELLHPTGAVFLGHKAVLASALDFFRKNPAGTLSQAIDTVRQRALENSSALLEWCWTWESRLDAERRAKSIQDQAYYGLLNHALTEHRAAIERSLEGFSAD
jgi:hypothetical protein